MSTPLPALCRVCPAHCPILVRVEEGVVVEVKGDPENPLYGGYTCPKGRALPEQHNHAGRLLHSRKRATEGHFERIASGQAIDEIAARVTEILTAHGPRSVAMYVGTNALPYPTSPALANSWLRAIGSRMFFTSNTIDQPGKQIATALHGSWHAGAQAFETAESWLIVGQNPVLSKAAGVPSHNPAQRLKDAAARGMKLVVIDPRRTETARRAHVHLQPRPGEDPTLLAAMLHVILAKGLHDAAFLAENAEGLKALEQAVRPFTPALAAQRADVPEAQLLEAARAFAGASRGGAVAGTGPSFATRGNLTEYLALALTTVCGFWPRAGEPATRPNAMLPAFTPRAQPYPPYRASGFGEKLRVRGLTNTAAGMPTAALADEILLPGEDQVRALFCLGSNPMMAWPDQRKAEQALEKLDLLVTLDPEMSATARLADYVIATRLTLETPGMSQPAENLKYFGPSVGYAQAYAQYAPKLVEPPEGSDVIEEWELFYGLAQRMELGLQLVGFYGWGRHIESPPVVTQLDMEHKPSSEALHELLVQGSRIPLEEVKRHPHGHIFDEVQETVQPREAGNTARLQLGDPQMLRELQEVAAEDWRARQRDAEFGFLLIPRRSNFFVNSTGRSLATLTRGKPWNPAYLHPLDLEALGLASGDLARLRSRHASVLAVVEADTSLRRGVVSLTHAFGGLPSAPEEPRRLGTNPGRLLRADDDYDPITGIPRMGALPIAVEGVDEETAPA